MIVKFALHGDVVDVFADVGMAGKPRPLADAGGNTLQEARNEYARIKRELDLRGYRLDHARIVGPQGEVYDVETK